MAHAGWEAHKYDPMATGQGQARPPADGNQVDRPYFVHSATGHAQWDKPFSRVAVRLTRAGYQANFAASSLRGLLGFDACLCPAVLSGGERDGRSKPGALGKGGVSGTGEPDVRREYLAQSSPRITWSNFKAVLALVVTGLPGFLLPLLCVCVRARAPSRALSLVYTFPTAARALTHGRICDSLGCGTSGLVRVDLEYVPQVPPLRCLAAAERGASGVLTAPVRCACRSPRRRRTLPPASKAATLMRQATRRLSAWCSPRKIPCHMHSVSASASAWEQGVGCCMQ